MERPEGVQVRFDAYVDSPDQALRVAETLTRMAVGLTTEGHVASIIVIPSGVEAEIETTIDFDLYPTDGED
jgi:hypothetical protein